MSNNFFNITTLVFVLFVWSQPKPNLVVIMTDDMGYEDVGFNGCKDIPTCLLYTSPSPRDRG